MSTPQKNEYACEQDGCLDRRLHREHWCYMHAVARLSELPIECLLARILLELRAPSAGADPYQTRLLERMAHHLDGR